MVDTETLELDAQWRSGSDEGGYQSYVFNRP